MTYGAVKSGSSCKTQKIVLLSLSWIFGIFVGCGIFYTCRPFFASLMRSAVSQTVSIVGMLTSVFLPFFFTYCFLLSDKPVYVLIVSFIKALSFGFVASLLEYQYSSARWLLQFLFLFSDFCTTPLLFWLWLQMLSGVTGRSIKLRLVFSVFLSFVLVTIDFTIISPLLFSLL